MYEVNDEFLTFFVELDDVDTLEKEKLVAYDFKKPISIADQLEGCTELLLYVELNVEFTVDTMKLQHFEADEAYLTLVKDMFDKLNIKK